MDLSRSICIILQYFFRLIKFLIGIVPTMNRCSKLRSISSIQSVAHPAFNPLYRLIHLPCGLLAFEQIYKQQSPRERKKHTARRVAIVPSVVLSWGAPHPDLALGVPHPDLTGGYFILGYASARTRLPPRKDLGPKTWDQRPGKKHRTGVTPSSVVDKSVNITSRRTTYAGGNYV